MGLGSMGLGSIGGIIIGPSSVTVSGSMGGIIIGGPMGPMGLLGGMGMGSITGAGFMGGINTIEAPFTSCEVLGLVGVVLSGAAAPCSSKQLSIESKRQRAYTFGRCNACSSLPLLHVSATCQVHCFTKFLNIGDSYASGWLLSIGLVASPILTTSSTGLVAALPTPASSAEFVTLSMPVLSAITAPKTIIG